MKTKTEIRADFLERLRLIVEAGEAGLMSGAEILSAYTRLIAKTKSNVAESERSGQRGAA